MLATNAFWVTFTVVSALEWLDRMKMYNTRLTRWSLSLLPYQFRVTYQPGKSNGNVNALSRQTNKFVVRRTMEECEGVCYYYYI